MLPSTTFGGNVVIMTTSSGINANWRAFGNTSATTPSVGVLNLSITIEEGRLLQESLPYNACDYVAFVRKGIGDKDMAQFVGVL